MVRGDKNYKLFYLESYLQTADKNLSLLFVRTHFVPRDNIDKLAQADTGTAGMVHNAAMMMTTFMPLQITQQRPTLSSDL